LNEKKIIELLKKNPKEYQNCKGEEYPKEVVGGISTGNTIVSHTKSDVDLDVDVNTPKVDVDGKGIHMPKLETQVKAENSLTPLGGIFDDKGGNSPKQNCTSDNSNSANSRNSSETSETENTDNSQQLEFVPKLLPKDTIDVDFHKPIAQTDMPSEDNKQGRNEKKQHVNKQAIKHVPSKKNKKGRQTISPEHIPSEENKEGRQTISPEHLPSKKNEKERQTENEKEQEQTNTPKHIPSQVTKGKSRSPQTSNSGKQLFYKPFIPVPQTIRTIHTPSTESFTSIPHMSSSPSIPKDIQPKPPNKK